MGTQNTNEMEFCRPNHIFIISNYRGMMLLKLKSDEVFVLSIPTRGALPTLYAYRKDYNKERVSYSLNLLLNTLIHKREKYPRLHQSRVHDRRNYSLLVETYLHWV
jgi:hypothetical protein